MTPATRAARAVLLDLHPDADQTDTRALEADAERIAGAVLDTALDRDIIISALEAEGITESPGFIADRIIEDLSSADA